VDLQSGLRRNGLTLVEKTSKGDIPLVDVLKLSSLSGAILSVSQSTKPLLCPLLKRKALSDESGQNGKE
jgi:hypothetical protein